jgi:hypothetical protein
MGINNAAKLHRPNLWICTDEPRRFLGSIWTDPTITKFMPVRLRHLCPSDSRNVWAYNESNTFNFHRYLTDGIVHWGASTMFAAVRVLHDLGVTELYLLGADLQMDAAQPYAFDEVADDAHARRNTYSYSLIERRFGLLRPLLEAHGLKIWNCNPDSRLTAFPFMPYDQAARRVAGQLGVDPRQEPTRGLYGCPTGTESQE